MKSKMEKKINFFLENKEIKFVNEIYVHVFAYPMCYAFINIH